MAELHSQKKLQNHSLKTKNKNSTLTICEILIVKFYFLEFFKAHLVVSSYFFVVLPGRESNLGCWERIPASYHLTTPTPFAED